MKYQVAIIWSNEDDAFLAFSQDLPGCLAHGSTQIQALEEFMIAMEGFLEVLREEGLNVPPATDLETAEKHLQRDQKEFEKSVKQAASQMIKQVQISRTESSGTITIPPRYLQGDVKSVGYQAA